MCFDRKTSLNTLIAGTIVNVLLIYYLIINKNFNNVKAVIILIIAWQYALLMQIPDFLAWDAIEKNKTPEEYIGKIAYFLNITQPLFFLMCTILILYLEKKKSYLTYPAIGFSIIYIFIVLFSIGKLNFSINSKKCKTLDYSWWGSNESGSRNVPPSGNPKSILFLYFLIMIISCFMIQDIDIRLTNLLIFFISLVGSIYYKNIINEGNECAVSSLWCMSIFPAGLFIFIVYVIKNKVIRG